MIGEKDFPFSTVYLYKRRYMQKGVCTLQPSRPYYNLGTNKYVAITDGTYFLISVDIKIRDGIIQDLGSVRNNN